MPEAEAAVSQAARLVPEAQLASVRGRIAMARRDPPAAERFFREAIEVQPKDSSLEVDLSQALAAQGRTTEADAAFRRGLAKATTVMEKERAYGDVATYYQLSGNEVRVFQVLREGTAALPTSASLWAMLGAAHGRASQMEDAIDAYERSVAAQPTPLTCKTLGALLYEIRHDRARATALWKQSLALQPGQPDVEAFLKKLGVR